MRSWYVFPKESVPVPGIRGPLVFQALAFPLDSRCNWLCGKSVGLYLFQPSIPSVHSLSPLPTLPNNNLVPSSVPLLWEGKHASSGYTSQKLEINPDTTLSCIWLQPMHHQVLLVSFFNPFGSYLPLSLLTSACTLASTAQHSISRHAHSSISSTLQQMCLFSFAKWRFYSSMTLCPKCMQILSVQLNELPRSEGTHKTSIRVKKRRTTSTHSKQAPGVTLPSLTLSLL